MTQSNGENMPTILSKIAFNRLKTTANKNNWLVEVRKRYPETWTPELGNPKKYNRYLLYKLKNNPQILEIYIQAITNRIVRSSEYETEIISFVENSGLSSDEKTLLENYIVRQKTLETINLELKKTETQFSPKTIEATRIILESNLDNLKNPTIITILEYIEIQLQKNKPLDLAVVNCLKRDNYVQTLALPALKNFREGGTKSIISDDIIFFDSDSVSIKGWAEIKKLIQKLEKIDIDLQPTIYLGDTDFYFLTLDNFRNWAENSNSLETLFNQQIESIQDNIQAKADKYFGDNAVQIKKLSDIVEVDSFDNFNQGFNSKQATRKSEIVNKLIELRQIDYIQIWKTLDDMLNCGYAQEESLEIISQEANTIVAQYAYEFNFYPGLFGFAESTKDTFFCFNSPDPFGDNPKPVFILNRRKS